MAAVLILVGCWIAYAAIAGWDHSYALRVITRAIYIAAYLGCAVIFAGLMANAGWVAGLLAAIVGLLGLLPIGNQIFLYGRVIGEDGLARPKAEHLKMMAKN